MKRESCLQCVSRVKKPRPAGHVKYLSPLNVPSEHADCSSSCKVSKVVLIRYSMASGYSGTAPYSSLVNKPPCYYGHFILS